MPDDDRKVTTDDRPATTDLLRHRIDRGLAGDKKGFPDPAAAPLGTDDEAAGTPPTPEQIALAHAQEVENRPDSPDVTHTGPVLPGHAERHGDPWIWLVVAVGAVLAAIVLASMV